MIKLTEEELRKHLCELFRSANQAFADMEDNIVEGVVREVVEKHSEKLSTQERYSIGGPFGSRPGPYVKTPVQIVAAQQQRGLFDDDDPAHAQAVQAESNF